MNDKTLVNQEFRSTIEDLEKSFEKSPDVIKVEIDTQHHYAHGVYSREVLIPKGCTLTGKIHRHSCINVITKGKITVETENGQKLITAPAVLISPPGTKRAGYAHSDTIWMTFHHTEQTNHELIEQEVIAKSYYDYENEPDPVFPPAGLNKIEEETLQHLLAKKRRGISK